MSIIPTAYPGVGRQRNLTRNGQLANAPAFNKVAGSLNTILAHRNKVLFRHFMHPYHRPSAVFSPATNYQFQCQFHTSPNVQNVSMKLISIIGGYADGTPDPRFQWTITDSTATDHAQAIIYRGDSRNVFAGENAIVPSDMAFHNQIFSLNNGAKLAGNATYTAKLAVMDGARTIGAVIYEWNRWNLTTDDVHVALVAAGQPILTTQLTQAFDAVNTIWERQGTSHITWSHDGYSGRNIASSTYTNVLDGTTTSGYSATAPSFWIYPRNRGSYHSTSVPVVCWVNAKVASGTGGSIIIKDTNGTIGTISGIGVTQGFYTATGALLDTTAAAGTNVTIEAKDTASDITVYAAGMYEYQA